MPKFIKQDQFRNIWFFHAGEVGVLRFMEDGSYKKVIYPFVPIKNKLVNNFEYVYVPDRENVFFGIEDGYAHYLVNDIKNYRMPFKVHIRSFSVQGDSAVYVLNQEDNQKSMINHIPTYPFKNNSFEIHFAASFFSDKKIEYKTHLSGIDDGEAKWSKSTYRQYTNLKEGEYHFTIRARNSYGVETSPLVFTFEVLTPWYRSSTAKIIYVLILLGLLILVLYFFNRHIHIMQAKATQKQKKEFEVTKEKLKSDALHKEKEVIRIRNERLKDEMAFKEKELACLTVHIVQKNDLLSELQRQLKRLVKVKQIEEIERKLNNLATKIGKDINNESNWLLFEKQFEQVHQSFLNRLTENHPTLTPKERKLCAYIKMGMVSKEVASLMNISTRAVENNRYKLRQKFELQSGKDLFEFISNI
jgi:DNA-binding CsgD family transcriptional regulator